MADSARVDAEEYRRKGKEVVDYIADYLATIRDRPTYPNVRPGFIYKALPASPPEQPEKWTDVMADFENVVMPGITHWLSPHMHAYFPANNSVPSMLAEMLTTATNTVGFTWAASPSSTELECLTMDWLAEAMGLPEKFFHKFSGPGGGSIQTTASDSNLLATLTARTKAINTWTAQNNRKVDETHIVQGKLVAYCSGEAHISIQKAARISMIKLRTIQSSSSLQLDPAALSQAIKEDKAAGLIPFLVFATLGSTSVCSFDNLLEIGPICREEDIWLHVDAAYAGSALVCPEFRSLMPGLEFTDSFVSNPGKWLLVSVDCAAFWISDRRPLYELFGGSEGPAYLDHDYSHCTVDFMHWQTGLSRRFRALKLWFVMRSYGTTGLQKHIRKGVEHAKYMESLVRTDARLEIPVPLHLGLVVFRIKGADDKPTKRLLEAIQKDGRMYLVSAYTKGQLIIRFTITSQHTTRADLDRDWGIIQEKCTQVLQQNGITAGTINGHTGISVGGQNGKNSTHGPTNGVGSRSSYAENGVVNGNGVDNAKVSSPFELNGSDRRHCPNSNGSFLVEGCALKQTNGDESGKRHLNEEQDFQVSKMKGNHDTTLGVTGTSM